MKMNFLIYLSIFCCVLAVPARAEKLELQMCYEDNNRPPYFLGKGALVPQLGQRGIIVDAIDEASNKSKIKINWIRAPWKRCIAMFKTGLTRGVAVAIYRPEWEQFSRFPKTLKGKIDTQRTVSVVNYNFYENEKKPLGWKGDFDFDRSQMLIGAPRGYAVSKLLKDKGFDVIENLTPEEGLKRVATGNLRAYVFAKESAGVMVKKMAEKGRNIRRVDPAVLTTYLYVPIFGDTYMDHPKTIEHFWTELSKIMKNKLAQ